VIDVDFAPNLLEKVMARLSIIWLIPVPFITMCPAPESPLVLGRHSTTVVRPLDMAAA
jgi:hypothetical protein